MPLLAGQRANRRAGSGHDRAPRKWVRAGAGWRVSSTRGESPQTTATRTPKPLDTVPGKSQGQGSPTILGLMAGTGRRSYVPRGGRPVTQWGDGPVPPPPVAHPLPPGAHDAPPPRPPPPQPALPAVRVIP